MKLEKSICLFSKGWPKGKNFLKGEDSPEEDFFFDKGLKNPYTDKQVDIEDQIAAEKDKQAALELDSLKLQYQAKFGKKPHGRAGIETLKKALEDASEHDNSGGSQEVTGNTSRQDPIN